MIIRSALAFLILLAAAPAALSGTATITPASPLRPAPSGTVDRGGLAPIPGTSVAAERAGPPPAYTPQYGGREVQSGRPVVPAPEFNRVAVSFCQMDLDP